LVLSFIRVPQERDKLFLFISETQGQFHTWKLMKVQEISLQPGMGCTPVIPAIEEVEMERLSLRPAQTNLARPHLKNKI
jgi:hypothetical protein